MKNQNNKNIKTMRIFFLAAFLGCFISQTSAQCVKGNCHRGHGTFNWESGHVYAGSWSDGLPSGYGDFFYDNGDSYKGQFVKGKKTGNGRYTWKNGNYYDGSWGDDKANGRGKYHWAKEGATFEGYFKDGQITNIEVGVAIETPEKD